MKALQKIINSKIAESNSSKSRTALLYLQVKEGFVYATDTHEAVKIPVKQVFGEIVTDDEEFYIHVEQWKAAKMDKAASIKRNGLEFESLTRKGDHLGFVKAVAEIPDVADAFLIYPPVDAIIPEDEPVFSLGINAQGLKNIADTLGCDALLLEVTKFNSERGIRVTPVTDYAKDRGAIAVTMPLANFLPTNFASTEAPEASTTCEPPCTPTEWAIVNKDLEEAKSMVEQLDDELSDLKEELGQANSDIADLKENRLDKDVFTTVRTANGNQLLFHVDNPVDE